MTASDSRNGLRVIKVGGSLFDLQDLPQRLAAALANASPMADLFIPGGGALADGVRDYDAVLRLPASVAHDVAVGTMHLMAQMLSAATGYPIIASPGAVAEARSAGAKAILDVRHLLSAEEPQAPGEPLERNWAVTSDSIAARLARVLNANELWLCKSTVAEPGADAAQLAAVGLVDEAFPKYSAGLRWRVLDLRLD